MQAKNFIKKFIEVYISHGGRVENKTPAFVGGISDEGNAVEATWLAAGNQAKLRPQLLIFCVPGRTQYLRIKKSCDCRYGVASQVMINRHVVAAQPQYMSNVLMKVNAKLGGTTARVKAVSLHSISQIEILTLLANHCVPIPQADCDHRS